jgi:hypothetical protein
MEEHKTEHRPKVSRPGRHTLNLYLKQWQIPLWNDAVTKCRFCNKHPKGYELNPKSQKIP